MTHHDMIVLALTGTVLFVVGFLLGWRLCEVAFQAQIHRIWPREAAGTTEILNRAAAEVCAADLLDMRTAQSPTSTTTVH
jgi:hypothetical protein